MQNKKAYYDEFIKESNLENKYKEFAAKKEFNENWIGKEFWLSGFYEPKKIVIIGIRNSSNRTEAEYKNGGNSTWIERFDIKQLNKPDKSTNAVFTDEIDAWRHFINKCREEITYKKAQLISTERKLMSAQRGRTKCLNQK